MSNPPALRPADSSRPPPFGGGAADFEGFLEALRLFSVESDFAGFYAGHRETYRDFETTARHEAGRRDFPGVVENYVGRNLESRCHYLLALSYAAKSGASYIIPYPNAELGTAAHGPYDVYVLLTPEILDERPSFFGAYRGMLLDELIYVFIERTYFPYMKAHAAEESALLGALGSACRDRDCLKDALVRAIGQRLRAAVCSEGMRCNEKRLKKTDAVAGLFAGRLAEYEGARDRYPALDDFYPRLFSAPPEIARPASSSVTAP